MAQKSLAAALVKAGLDDETAKLIKEEEEVAQFLAEIAVLVRKQRQGRIPRVWYHGRIILVKLPEIVARLRERDGEVTETAVAREYGVGSTAFNNVLQRYPPIREFYEFLLQSDLKALKALQPHG